MGFLQMDAYMIIYKTHNKKLQKQVSNTIVLIR